MMKREQIPNFTSGLSAYNAASVKALESDISDDGNDTIFGGVCNDGKWAWLVRGQTLEVIHTANGVRQTAWCFNKDSTMTISCVREYRLNQMSSRRSSVRLLVGLKCRSGGMLCVFNPYISKVTAAITIPYKVSTIEPITNVGGIRAPNYLLSSQLHLFFGMVAVGTDQGYVYLIDLRLDEDGKLSDETYPSKLLLISSKTQGVEEKRIQAVRRGEHLALLVDEHCHKRSSYDFREPNGNTIRSYYASEVSITALKFIKQTGSLVIGFSFGCFQLWSLIGPILEYASPLENNSSPVTHFAYQEPDDDPRYCCYLWLSKGPVCTESSQDIPVSLYLFQLTFEERENHDYHGYLYKTLEDCSPKFKHDLTSDIYNLERKTSVGSRLFTCSTLVNEFSPDRMKHEDSTLGDHVVNRTDLSQALFAWEAPSAGQGSQTSCFLALFDLNRWYHAQMPVSVRQSQEPNEMCSYLSFYTLDSVMEAAAPDVLLDVYVDPHRISKFKSCITPAPEQHFYPSASSFKACCVMETGVVRSEFLGVQRQVMADMCKLGPVILWEPQEYFSQCWMAGLLPRTLDQSITTTPVQLQRDSLLTVALENTMLGLIISCIQQWSEGGFPSGCTLRSILDWAWNKVATIKESLDRICTPLYDGYGTHLDKQTLSLCNQHAVHLSHMVLIFQALLDQSGTTTEQGLRDLETKLHVVTLICQHLQVILWFIRNNLLPEYPDDLDVQIDQFCYPCTRLGKIYTNRRGELQRLCGPSCDSDILLIDGIVSQLGQPLYSLWLKEEGGTGRYPPPSLHAVLDMYLLEGGDLLMEHCIVTYLLLDIAGSKQDQVIDVERMKKFPKSFCLPLRVIKLIQGFWLLDHKHFEEALTMLLDPMITTALAPWQHSRVIKAFLYQGHSEKALQYIRTKQPALENLDDVKLYLTVLLTKGLTAEAFLFQRQYRDQDNAEELLHHLFLGAQQTKTVDNLLKLPFSQLEESALSSYLKESTEANSKELLVMHHLQRARYVEAIRMNESLKHSLMSESDGRARDRASARNAIVDSYARLLPQVQRKMAFGPEQKLKQLTVTRREVIRPKPLSTVVHRVHSGQPISYATMLNAVLDKISEARSRPRVDETPTKKRLSNITSGIAESEPFVGTPLTPQSKGIPSENRSLVYPTVSYPEDTPQLKVTSPTKHKSFGSPHQMTVTDLLTPTTMIDRMKRHTVDYRGAAALSLLQTPPVKRRTVGSFRRAEKAIPQQTPQSILKVKKTIRRSPSPAKETQRPSSPKIDGAQMKPKQLSVGFAGNLKLETPPKLQAKPKRITFEPEKVESPRHIRFAEGTKDVTPSPDEEISVIPGVSDEAEMPLVEESIQEEISLDKDSEQAESPLAKNESGDESLELRLDDSHEIMAVDDEITFDFHRTDNSSKLVLEQMEEEDAVEQRSKGEAIMVEVIDDDVSMETDAREERESLEPEVLPQRLFTSPQIEQTPERVRASEEVTVLDKEPSPDKEQGVGLSQDDEPTMGLTVMDGSLAVQQPTEIGQEEINVCAVMQPSAVKEPSPEKEFVEGDTFNITEQREAQESAMESVKLVSVVEPDVEPEPEIEPEPETQPEPEIEPGEEKLPEDMVAEEIVPDESTPQIPTIATQTSSIYPQLPIATEPEDESIPIVTPLRRSPSPPGIPSESVVNETGVQTTPGLAMRQPMDTRTPSFADAFKASLKSTNRTQRQRKCVDKREKADTEVKPIVKEPSPSIEDTTIAPSVDTPIKEVSDSAASSATGYAATSDSVYAATSDSVYTSDLGTASSSEDVAIKQRADDSEDEPMSFTFSEPMTVTKPQDEAPPTPTPSTATPRFVFSPPLTRSQMRRKQKQLLTPDQSLASDASPRLIPKTTEPPKRERKSTAPTTKRVTRSRRPVALPSDSPINFISPVPEAATEQRTRRVTRRSVRVPQTQTQEKPRTGRAKTRSGKLWSYDN
ncbi:protein ELYS-like [Glandiceps talaboti]